MSKQPISTICIYDIVIWFLLLLIVLKLSIIIRYDKHKVGEKKKKNKLKSAKHFRNNNRWCSAIISKTFSWFQFVFVFIFRLYVLKLISQD